MSFYRYEPDADVHVVDCSGKVDLEVGLERLQLLKRELAARPPTDGIAKLLIDFQATVWAGEDVHLELSRITRSQFGLNPQNTRIRAAFVNARFSGQVADNEAWFQSRADAMHWLTRSST